MIALCEGQAAFRSAKFLASRKRFHSQGSSSCRREVGRSAMRARASASQAIGSMSLRRAVVIRVSMTAARSAPLGTGEGAVAPSMEIFP